MSLVPRYCPRCGGKSGHLICPPQEADDCRIDISELFSQKQLDISLLTKRCEELEERLVAATNQVASQKEILDTVHGHVFEACKLLNVDTDERAGDSWTLLEAAREAKALRLRIPEVLEDVRNEILKTVTDRIREMVRGRTWLEVELGTRIASEIRALLKECS